MSYLVLARKYRPKTFADVAGQAHVIRPLVNALKSGRIAHAYLFSGARGVGKTTAARLLAMALNCPEAVDDPPCGQCSSCLEIIDGNGVDVFEIDGASNRGINEIRDLRETIQYLPSKGKYKVYIIDEVHMLTKEAFNALLKTLEEPPEHVVFIFATTESHKVLPTILSRCQRYDFKRITSNDVVARLAYIAEQEKIEISQTGLRLLARESEGGLRDALSLLDQVLAFSGNTVDDEDLMEALGLIDQTLIFDLSRALLAGDAGAALDLLDRVYHFGHDSRDFASQVLGHFRALVVAKVSRNAENILDLLDTELEAVQEQARETSLETLNFHFNAWLDVQDRLQRASQPRLVLEALIIRLAQVEPLRPLAEVAAKLEAILDAAGFTVSGGNPPASGYGGGSGPGNSPRSNGATTRLSHDTRPNEYRPRPVAPPAAPSPPPQPSSPMESRPEEPGRPEAEPAVNAAPKPRDLSWDAFSELAETQAPAQWAIIGQGQARVFTPEEVELAIGDKSQANLVDEDKIRNLLVDFFGTKPKFSLVVDESLDGPGGRRAAIEEAKNEIIDQPLIKEARKIFQAEVLDVVLEE